jgi:hypothetical protein
MSRQPATKLKVGRVGGRGRDGNDAAATEEGAFLVAESGNTA